MLRGLRLASIVAANTLSQILARTYVASSGFLAAKDVTVKHSSSSVNDIGLVGFEPTASWSRTRRSTKLSHSPNCINHSGEAIGATYFAYFSVDGKEIESLPEVPRLK
jgi:hypothetical protein